MYSAIEQTWQSAPSTGAGFRLPGGVLGALLGLWIFGRLFLPGISIGLIGDLGAVALQFGLVIVRLGCLAAGCCFGTVTDVPWAIRFPQGTYPAEVHASLGWIGPNAVESMPVHPLQVYFMLLHLAAGVFLVWFAPRKAYNGQVLLLSILIVQTGKAVLEIFRQPVGPASSMHLMWASLALAAGAAVLLAVAGRLPARTVRLSVPT
jgi:phosphatidylglycerol:prolipoprotein diacylglycerol transferase